MTKLSAIDIVGKNAISMQSGSNLYEHIAPTLLSGQNVELDFDGVELFASPFFNASIGLLLKDIQVTDLQERLNISNISDVGRQLLNHVISNAIRFYETSSKSGKPIQASNKDGEDQ
jgi:hypothetical protein